METRTHNPKACETCPVVRCLRFGLLGPFRQAPQGIRGRQPLGQVRRLPVEGWDRLLADHGGLWVTTQGLDLLCQVVPAKRLQVYFIL